MARHILLADDSTTIHRIVTDILQKEGMRVTCVENGEEALRSILESAPDMVLADLTMPRMGGIELCEWLKREPEFRNIPVLFLVSPFDDYNEAAASRVGGAGHLVKPFDSYRLMTLVKKFLPSESREAEGLEDQDVATIEQIDDPDDEASDAVLTRSFHGTDPALGDFDDLADLPEPLGLSSAPATGRLVDDLSALSSLELTETDRAIESETVELDVSHLRALTVDLAGETGELSGEDVEAQLVDAVRAQLDSLGGASAVERILREVIREEVRRLLPSIVESVVRERVLELERELEARTREAAPVRGEG
jgi:CheY-like chemotaxis protein